MKTTTSRGKRSTVAPALEHLRNTPPPQYVELIAMAERCLNFAHTGAAKVLTRGLMGQTWPSRALVDGYLPMFWEGLKFHGTSSTEPAILLTQWPLDAKTKKPYVASKRAQELTYGSAHFLVSLLSACQV